MMIKRAEVAEKRLLALRLRKLLNDAKSVPVCLQR
jgi:hypothetical protein